MIDTSTPAIANGKTVARVAAAAILLQRGGRAGGALRWDAVRHCWRWPDPQGSRLFAWSAPPATPVGLRLSEGACALATCASGRLLLGQGKRLGMVDLPPAGAARPLMARVLLTVDAAEPRTAISDGCTDRAGNFVFGTANTASDQRPIGSFYQYSQRHGLRRLALPVVVRAAGIAFSADGARMYFADGGRILHCTYDAERARVGKVATFAESTARVAAAVIDRSNCLWSIQGGELVHYDAEGAALRRIALDVLDVHKVPNVHNVPNVLDVPDALDVLDAGVLKAGVRAPASLAFGGDGLGRLLLLGADGALYDLPAGLLDAATAGLADTLFDDAAQPAKAVG